ncbi:MAG: cysteine desulfurase family protein [Candidatus Paceibacterota bacterium]|jgi:cysteine desulfurase
MKVYFDNAATTKVDSRVFEAMKPYFSDIYGNASSLHGFGLSAKQALEEAREVIARKINARHNEIIFTSGATEADNLAIRGVAYKNNHLGNHIITTKIEHPAVLESCRFLETQGFKITYLSVDREGFVNLEELKRSLGEKTILVSIIFANNEIGIIQPIKEIGKIIKNWNEKHNSKIIFHSDAVQAFTKIDINVNDLNLDLLSISSHKIYGPKGIGALYVKEGTKIEKIAHGGHHEYNLRPGTENVTSAVGFAKALELFNPKNYEAVKSLRAYLIKEVLKNIPDSYLNGPLAENVLPNIANFIFKGAEGEAIMLLLDKEGIAVSTGSACASHSLEPSYVLLALGVPKEEAHGSIRVSLGLENKKEEVDYTVKVFKKVIKRLRDINPLR